MRKANLHLTCKYRFEYILRKMSGERQESRIKMMPNSAVFLLFLRQPIAIAAFQMDGTCDRVRMSAKSFDPEMPGGGFIFRFFMQREISVGT